MSGGPFRLSFINPAPSWKLADVVAVLNDNISSQSTGGDMDDAGKFEHALTAVLYAVRRKSCDLETILRFVKEDIISNSIRPLPQDQSAVIAAVEQAILDVELPFGEPEPHAIRVPSPAPHPPEGIPGADDMPCPDCKGKQKDEDGDLCNLCNGTGVVARY